MRIRSGALAAALFAVAIAAPGARAADRITLPEHRRTVLDNGLVVYVMPLEGLPLVDLRLVVKSGSAADPAGKEGLANLVAEVLTQGAGERDAVQLAEAIEFEGGTLEADAASEHTAITAEFLSPDLGIALDLLADVVLRPSFRDEEVERSRNRVLGRIENDKDQPSVVATNRFRQALFGEHRLAHPSYGLAASVRGLTRADVVAFHARHYVPNNAILVLVGDVEASRGLEAIRERFSGWERGGPAPETGGTAAPVSGRRVIIVEKPDVTQTQIRIGNVGIERDHPDWFAVQVANTVLGSGFTSRLINEIRVNRGLSYSAWSAFVPYRESGMFLVGTFTKNPTIRETIDVALEEIRKLREEGVGEEELQGAKNYRKGLFPLGLEAPEDLADIVADIEFYGLPADYVETYWERIDAVTAGDVRRVVREHFDLEDLLFLVVSNPEEARPQLASLGKVEVWALE